jgi:hypothetical protein
VSDMLGWRCVVVFGDVLMVLEVTPSLVLLVKRPVALLLIAVVALNGMVVPPLEVSSSTTFHIFPLTMICRILYN